MKRNDEFEGEVMPVQSLSETLRKVDQSLVPFKPIHLDDFSPVLKELNTAMQNAAEQLKIAAQHYDKLRLLEQRVIRFVENMRRAHDMFHGEKV